MRTGLVHLVRIVHVLLSLFLFSQKPDTPKASGKASVAYVGYLSSSILIHLHSFVFLVLRMLWAGKLGYVPVINQAFQAFVGPYGIQRVQSDKMRTLGQTDFPVLACGIHDIPHLPKVL